MEPASSFFDRNLDAGELFGAKILEISMPKKF
jgi:hypothetical protein